MDRFQEMRTFVTVVEAGSFVRASEELVLSKAAVSRQVNDLEERLGFRLLNRTTRRLSLTGEGDEFFARAKELLTSLEQLEADVAARRGQIAGTLKVTVPVSFGMLVLAPLWASFMEQHPLVRLEVVLSDHFVNLVDEGFDLAVRIAHLEDSSLISRRLGATRLLLCATPTYLAANGHPQHPAELSNHLVIAYSLLTTGDGWQFSGPDGQVNVRTRPKMRSNSGDTCHAVALAHQGIVLEPSFVAAADLASGTLVHILPTFRAQELGIYAVYPSRKLMAPKVRALVDYLAIALQDKTWT